MTSRQTAALDVWLWICELPDSEPWTESNSLFVYQLASTSTRSIQLRAEQAFGSNSETFLKFSLHLLGFTSEDVTLWVSDMCPLSSDKPFLPLLMQLLQEIISHSPAGQDRSNCPELKPDPVSWILDTHSPESFSSFFNLVLLTRLFWLCACHAPSDAGSVYFHSLVAPNIEAFSFKHAPVLRTFLVSVGTDVELCFTRTFGYILTKWLILGDVGPGLKTIIPSSNYNLGFSYAMESHGLWVLKGHTPVKSMKLCSNNSSYFRGIDGNIRCSILEAKENLLRYTLAHQQLEAVIQFEYKVGFFDGFIHVNARVDNIRLHVVKLGFNKEDEDGNFVDDEKYFPSRIRTWVGPEIGASYVGSLSLGGSTKDVVTEVETQKIMKGNFGSKVPEVKAMSKMSTRSKVKKWRWDEDAEGNTATFDGILYDNTTGTEIASWGDIGGGEVGNSFRRRYRGSNRVFTKKGGIVFGGGREGVVWRLSKDMEGSVLKWRIGGQVWLTYLPNEINSWYREARCVEWCHEVDLPLIPGPPLLTSP